jgi:hypothetical protein
VPIWVTDSATTARRRKKSMQPTRSATLGTPHKAVAAGRLSQPVHLGVRQVSLFGVPDPRQADPGRGIGGKPAILDRVAVTLERLRST